jgi:hypothetical protein
MIFENWVATDWWNRQRTLIHDWRMKSIDKRESSLTHGIASETASLLTINHQRKHSRCSLKIITEIWVTADVWNRHHDLRIILTTKIDWWLNMELSHTLCQCGSRNCHQKLSHCRKRNHLWKLSRGWLMESTTNTNSQLTQEINTENRVIIDAWNR